MPACCRAPAEGFAPGQTIPRFATLNFTACTSTSVQLLSVQTVQPGNALAGYGRQ